MLMMKDSAEPCFDVEKLMNFPTTSITGESYKGCAAASVLYSSSQVIAQKEAKCHMIRVAFEHAVPGMQHLTQVDAAWVKIAYSEDCASKITVASLLKGYVGSISYVHPEVQPEGQGSVCVWCSFGKLSQFQESSYLTI